MKKLVVRLALGAVGLVALASFAAWLTLRASLPQLEGSFEVDGLLAAVTIERDAAGIPVITASNRLDLAYATGFVHGQDRFFQMDMIRRQAAGELSEVVGAAAIDVDKRFRLHDFRRRARAVLASATEEERAFLSRYADGVNAGLNSLGSRPFEYFLLGSSPAPWTSEDSLLAVYAMFVQLNDSRATREIRRGRVASILPSEVFDWMYPDGTPWDAPIMGAAREVSPVPGAHVISLRGVADIAPPANEVGKAPLNGSNNWAVSGRLSADGRAIVSNDMHLGLSTPNIYYRARLVMTGPDARDVSGVTLPGSPFVIAGSNTFMGWGFTNSYGDYADAVIVRAGENEGTYRTADGDLEFVHRTDIIEVKDSDPVEVSFRETIWGPVREDVEYPDGEIAVRWIAHDAFAVNLNMIGLETARSVEEALDIANTMGMPPQNFVTGDSGGNIGWTIAGKIPVRVGFDPSMPADFSDGAGWHGYLAARDYPRVVNPDSGRIWTANARVANGDALLKIGDGGYDLGARAKQIRDGLFAKETFEPADMLAIQYDDRALFLAPWRDVLLELLTDEVVAADEALPEYRELVADWIPRAAPESAGYRLVRAFRLEVERRLFYALTAEVRAQYGDDTPLRMSNQFEAAVWTLVTERPEHMLPGKYQDWNEFLMAAVQQNLDYFRENYEGPLSDRTWGEANTAKIQHPLSRAVPLLSGFLDMPADQLNGDSNLPKAQGPSFGASERFSVSPGNEAAGLMHMPTGQSGHPLSDYYADGHADWVEGRASPFLPGEAVHTLTLSPARR